VYFKEHVLRHGNAEGKEEFAPEALLLSSSQAIADEVSQNLDAIGYYGMGYITTKEKRSKLQRRKMRLQFHQRWTMLSVVHIPFRVLY